jgi:hypothetical protein
MREKTVFIVSPSECSKHVDIVKEVVRKAEYEPVVATDELCLNESVFCTRICALIIQAPIVVVIGDWENRRSNACVAFEYGMATALRAEIVPIWTKGEASGFFDVRDLGAIIINGDATDQLTKLENEFGKRFVDAKKRVESKKWDTRLHPAESSQLEALFRRFRESKSGSEKTLIVNQFSYLVDLFNTHRFYNDLNLINWTKSILNDYVRDGMPGDYLGRPFFDHLLATTSYNCGRQGNKDALDDADFHSSLSAVVRDGRAAQHEREKCIVCLVSLSSHLGKPSLFQVVTELAESDELKDDMFNYLKIPDAFRDYVDKVYRAGGVPEIVFDFLAKPREDAPSHVQNRIHMLGKVFKRL